LGMPCNAPACFKIKRFHRRDAEKEEKKTFGKKEKRLPLNSSFIFSLSFKLSSL